MLINCSLENNLQFVVFADFVSILPPWPISKYPCDITECRDGKRQADLALMSWYESASANYCFVISKCSKLV